MMTTTPHISDSRDVDNRDKDEIIQLLEARVEALTKRVHDLEAELIEARKEHSQ